MNIYFLEHFTAKNTLFKQSMKKLCAAMIGLLKELFTFFFKRNKIMLTRLRLLAKVPGLYDLWRLLMLSKDFVKENFLLKQLYCPISQSRQYMLNNLLLSKIKQDTSRRWYKHGCLPGNIFLVNTAPINNFLQTLNSIMHPYWTSIIFNHKTTKSKNIQHFKTKQNHLNSKIWDL